MRVGRGISAAIAFHAAIVDAHHNEVHGADKHPNVTRELFLPANEGYVSGGTPLNIGFHGAVWGDANDAAPIVYFERKVPDDFIAFSKLEAVWVSPAASGNMFWQIGSHYGALGEVYNTHNGSVGLGPTATGGANIINVQEPYSAPTLPNLAEGDYMGLEFARAGTFPQDTLEDVVYFLGLLFTYIAEQ